MSAWTHPFLDWLGDYYILATALLLVTLLAGSLIRQPAKRYYVTAGAIIGLAILAVLCASPLWPRLVFIGRSASTIAGGPAEVSATPIVEPLAGRMPVVSGPPLVGSAKPQAERILRPNRRVNSQETGDIQNRTSARIDFPALVAAIFILGASIVSIWLAIGALRARRLCRLAQPAPDFALQELKNISLSLGERAGVRGLRIPHLFISHLIDIAAACGLLRPTILLPASALDEIASSPDRGDFVPGVGTGAKLGRSSHHTLTPSPAHALAPRSSPPVPASLRMLLAHEWAHICRGDLWLLAASRLLLVVLFAHPLYWLLRRRLRFDQELLADALAAQLCGRQQYAETLLAWARRLPDRRLSPGGALGIWNRPGQLSRRIAMLLDERIRPQVACSRVWKMSIAILAMLLVTALSLVTLRPIPVAKAESPASEQSELRAKLPISHDTPDDHIVARVGSEAILVSDIKAFLQQMVELKGGGEIKPDQLEAVFQESARPILKHLVEMKLVSNDAIHTIPAEGLKKIQANINDDFDKKQLPEMMKRSKAATRRELEAQLRKTGRSLEWERRAYFETQLYYGWIQQQAKIEFFPDSDGVQKYRAQHPDEKQDNILEKIKQDHREWQIKQYLDKLRQTTPVWTLFDDQPGSLDGTTAAKTNAPGVADALKTEKQMPPVDPAASPSSATKENDAHEAVEKISVTGTCVDEQQKPVANVRVRLFRIDHSSTPFSFPEARCKYTLSPSFGEQTAGPELQYVSQYFAPSSQRVLQETRSNEKGEFHFEGLIVDEGWREHGDAVIVVAQAPGKASNWSPLTINKQSGKKPTLDSPITIHMPKAGVIRGRITNQAGQPIAGAVVWKPGLLMLYQPVEGLACATTDADGRYEIADMNTGDVDAMPPMVTSIATIKVISFLLSVQHPDYADGVIEYSSLPAAVDGTLQPAATLRGQVFLDDGQESARKASLELSLDDGTSRYVPIDDTGKYSVSQLPPGHWHVRAWTLDRPAANGSIDLHAGNNHLELRLPKGGIIKGHIVDVATGKAPRLDPRIGGISLSAAIAGHDFRESCQGYMGDEGTFSIVVQPGKNLIGVLNPFWKLVDEDHWKTKGVEVAAGQTVEIELRLAAQIPTPPPLPKEPLSAKGVLAYLTAVGTGINTETIDGQECVTDIYTMACDRDGETPEMPRIGWLEKNVLLNIKEFPKLRTLGLTNPDGGDAALEPLRGVESLETLCIGGAPDVANQTVTSDLTMAAFDHLTKVPNLKMLYVMSPHFDDRAFSYIDRWPKLEGLMLGGAFTDDGVKQLHGKSQLKQLGVAAMGKSKIGNDCLREIGALTNLEDLGLLEVDEAHPQHWTVTDDGLAKLAGLTKLQTLTLHCPQITNAGLVHLRELKQLKHLDLKGTAVTQAGIDELKKSLPKLVATGYQGWKPALPTNADKPRETGEEPAQSDSRN